MTVPVGIVAQPAADLAAMQVGHQSCEQHRETCRQRRYRDARTVNGTTPQRPVGTNRSFPLCPTRRGGRGSELTDAYDRLAWGCFASDFSSLGPSMPTAYV